MGKVSSGGMLSAFILFLSIQAGAVTGGTPVPADMHQSVVNLLFEKGMCSGVVISPNVILTAAHCRDMGGAPVMATWLQPDVKTPECDISKIVDYAYVPNANPILPLNVHAPDLLMLKMEKPLCSTRPAILQDKALVDGDRVFQAGHGAGSGNFYQPFQVELEVIETDAPKDFVKPLRRLSEKLLDLGSDFYQFALPVVENSSACKNDSGGPTFVNQNGQMLLYGVNGAVMPNEDLGASRCNNFYFHLLAPVAPSIDWIRAQVEEWK